MKGFIFISICLILLFPDGKSAQSEDKLGFGQIVDSPSNEESDNIFHLINEIKYEIIASIEKQTELESIMVETDSVGNNIEVDVSVNLSKDAKVDEEIMRQLVEDIIRIISNKDNVTIGDIKITH